MSTEVRVPEANSVESLRQLVGDFLTGPIVRVGLLVLVIYPLGYARLWVQFQTLYNTDFATAWYAVPIAPREVVVVQGVLALWAPLVCVSCGAATLLAASVVLYPWRSRPRWRRPEPANRGAAKSLVRQPIPWGFHATVTLFALVVAVFVLFWFEWPRDAFLSGAVYGGVVAGYAVASRLEQGRFPRLGQLAEAGAIAYLVTVAVVAVDIGFVGMLTGKPVSPPEKRPLPFVEVVLRSELGNRVQPTSARRGLTCPPTQLCAAGSLLGRKDGFWYLFATIVDGEPLTLQAIPDGDVETVTSFVSGRRPQDHRYLRLTGDFPFVDIRCRSGDPDDPTPCGKDEEELPREESSPAR